MSIQTKCTCGAAFKAKSQLAGKRVKCPACGQPLVVPKPAQRIDGTPQSDIFADEPANDDPLGLGMGTDPDTVQKFDDAFGDALPQPSANDVPLPGMRPPAKPVDNETKDEKASLQIDGKMIAIISYLTLPGWIVAYVLHIKSDERSSLGAFHLRQSAGLIGLGFVLSVLMSLLFVFVPAARGVGGAVLSLVSLATTVHWIYGLVSAARGEEDYLISFLGDAFDGMFPWIN